MDYAKGQLPHMVVSNINVGLSTQFMLSKQVQGLNNRLGDLEMAASATSGSERGAVGTSRKGKNKQPKDNPKKAKGKQAFVDIEKERQYRLLTEQMRLRGSSKGHLSIWSMNL